METDQPPTDEWEECTITFRHRSYWGGGEHAGMNLGLLWFEARMQGARGGKALARSSEAPLAREGEFAPDMRNPVHLSLHQQLIDKLVEAGWQPRSGRGANWWEWRLRRRRG